MLIKFVMSSPELALSPQLYKLPMAGYYGGADSLSDMQKIIGNLSPAAWDLKYLKTTNIGEWDNKNYVDRPENFLGSYWIFNADFTSKRFDYLAEVQTLWKDSAPILMNQMNEAIVNSVSSR